MVRKALVKGKTSMTSKLNRVTMPLMILTTFLLVGADGCWYKTAATICGVGADTCASLAQADPQDSKIFDAVGVHLKAAQALLNTWKSDNSLAQNLINELAQAECEIKDLPELSKPVQAIVDVCFTSIEEVIALVVSNTRVPKPQCTANTKRAAIVGPKAQLHDLSAGKKALSADDLKKLFNSLAPQAGAKPI